MEILEILGLVVLVGIIFTGGGILGWIFRGIGIVLEWLLDGSISCLKVVFWIIIIIWFLKEWFS